MERQRPLATRILFITNGNVLMCTALAELLAADPALYTIDTVHYSDASLVDRLDHTYDLLIFFAVSPVSTLASRIGRSRNKDTNKQTKVLLVLAAADTAFMHYLSALAVDGIISIAELTSEFRNAIHVLVHDCKKYLSPKLATSLLGMPLRNDPLSCLSKKELDVAALTVQGKRNADIATTLNISPKTVSTYKTRVYIKLNVDNEAQLIGFAFRNRVLIEEGFFIEGGGESHERPGGTGVHWPVGLSE